MVVGQLSLAAWIAGRAGVPDSVLGASIRDRDEARGAALRFPVSGGEPDARNALERAMGVLHLLSRETGA